MTKSTSSQPAPVTPAPTHTSYELQDDNSDQASNILAAAQLVVCQEHLDVASELPVVPFTDTNIRPLCSFDTVRVYNITRVVYDRREDALNNLLNVYSSLGHSFGLSLIVRSDAKKTQVYLAVRAYSQKKLAYDGGRILTQAVEGHFPGSTIDLLDNESAHNLLGYCRLPNDNTPTGLRSYVTQANWGLSAAVTVPGLKDEEKIAFTQGIERLIDSMEGQEYTAVILAEPCSKQDVRVAQNGYESMLSSLSVFGKQQFTVSQSQSQTVSTALTASLSNSLMNSLAQTQTHSVSTTQTQTTTSSHAQTTTQSKSSNWNFNFSGATAIAGGIAGSFLGPIGTTAGVLLGAAIGGAVGNMLPSHNKSSGMSSSVSETESNSTSHSKQEGESDSNTTSVATTKQISKAHTDTASETHDASTSTVLEFRNVQIERLMQKIEAHLDRIDEVRAFGAWTAGAYFLSPEAETASTAASIYLAALRGEDSELGNTSLITWSNQAQERKRSIVDNLAELVIPRLTLAESPTGNITVTPAMMVSGKELALMMTLPRRPVGGIAVLDGVSFGREKNLLTPIGNIDELHFITLGPVYHLYKKRAASVSLSRNDFTRHVLVTGTTGTGKTTTIKHVLRQLHCQNIPFLVLEPAKSEYSELIELSRPDQPVHIFQVGRATDNCLRLNPLVFPQGNEITLMEHIDRVCALFNAAFPMYAAMPQIFEEAVVRSYERQGWDLISSRWIGQAPHPTFPTLRNVAEEIEEIVTNAGYDGESRSTYIGALKTRINSLMRGSLGLTFGAARDDETTAEELFDQPCIVNMASIGSPEKKAIIMGMLLIRLQEYRLSKGTPDNDNLHHLMVIEEAHNLLKGSSDNGNNMEVANPRGQAIEYFANLIAEMRAYGQGFLIADQSTSALDSSIQRNTNTKIAFCAPFETDREILAGALSLDEEQKKALARLESHTAIVKQNNWADAVQCYIDPKHNISKPLSHSSRSIEKNICTKDEAQDDKEMAALKFLFTIIGPHGVNVTIPTPGINDWACTLSQGGSAASGTWCKICHNLKYALTDEEIGQALYAFPTLTRGLQRAFLNSETPEGMVTRLNLEFEFLQPDMADAGVTTNQLISLLLQPCKGDSKVRQALQLLN